jgi:hypothetical protein
LWHGAKITEGMWCELATCKNLSADIQLIKS